MSGLWDSERVIFSRGFSVCCVVLMSHKNRAKQLSTTTTLLCFGSFRCRVWCLAKLILTLYDPLCKIECVYFVVLLNMSSVDPTFCGIFVCGPLQFKCVFLTSSKLIHSMSSMFQRVTFGEYSTFFHYYLISLILLFSLLFSFYRVAWKFCGSCGLAIFCCLREQIFAVQDDWNVCWELFFAILCSSSRIFKWKKL